MPFLPKDALILELNAGTGEDALYFASMGHRVHATDISAAMQEQLKEKVMTHGYRSSVTTELCSFTNLGELTHKGPYDHIFSNFAGLNCTADLDKVLERFDGLLRPGGMVTLVLLPPFCLWEFLLVFRGKFRTALRRFAGNRGAKAHIEGVHFRCWYYRPAYVQRRLGERFVTRKLEGLCTLVPPSYIEHFAEKHPRWYRRPARWENRLRTYWPWRSIGDYYIISLQKKG
jgi:ubiquinone/menaquinone biosynthesis C-methylase UbiE